MIHEEKELIVEDFLQNRGTRIKLYHVSYLIFEWLRPGFRAP